MLPSPPLAAELDVMVEDGLPVEQKLSPVLDIVPALKALRTVTTHDPLDVVPPVLHVPSAAFLVYVPAAVGVYVADVAPPMALPPLSCHV